MLVSVTGSSRALTESRSGHRALLLRHHASVLEDRQGGRVTVS